MNNYWEVPDETPDELLRLLDKQRNRWGAAYWTGKTYKAYFWAVPGCYMTMLRQISITVPDVNADTIYGIPVVIVSAYDVTGLILVNRHSKDGKALDKTYHLPPLGL